MYAPGLDMSKFKVIAGYAGLDELWGLTFICFTMSVGSRKALSFPEVPNYHRVTKCDYLVTWL